MDYFDVTKVIKQDETSKTNQINFNFKLNLDLYLNFILIFRTFAYYENPHPIGFWDLEFKRW